MAEKFLKGQTERGVDVKMRRRKHYVLRKPLKGTQGEIILILFFSLQLCLFFNFSPIGKLLFYTQGSLQKFVSAFISLFCCAAASYRFLLAATFLFSCPFIQ